MLSICINCKHFSPASKVNREAIGVDGFCISKFSGTIDTMENGTCEHFCAHNQQDLFSSEAPPPPRKQKQPKYIKGQQRLF